MSDFITDLLAKFGGDAVGVAGIGLITFLYINLAGLVNAGIAVVKQMKVVIRKFITDPDVIKMMELADIFLEKAATILRRFQLHGAAKKLSDALPLKKEDK
jgi:hypothetical protein